MFMSSILNNFQVILIQEYNTLSYFVINLTTLYNIETEDLNKELF